MPGFFCLCIPTLGVWVRDLDQFLRFHRENNNLERIYHLEIQRLKNEVLEADGFFLTTMIFGFFLVILAEIIAKSLCEKMGLIPQELFEKTQFFKFRPGNMDFGIFFPDDENRPNFDF